MLLEARAPSNAAPATHSCARNVCVCVVQEDLEATQTLAPAAAFEDETGLLEELRKLPGVFPGQPVLWVPRRSKQAGSDILCDLLADATLRGADVDGVVHAAGQRTVQTSSGRCDWFPN